MSERKRCQKRQAMRSLLSRSTTTVGGATLLPLKVISNRSSDDD
ncbi:hypothetical protein [Nostoc flagelliforme]